MYGVSKSKADQDVNKSAHLKAIHEAELHQIESDAHKQAAEIMQFSSKAILAHRFKAKAAQLRSEKRLQARIAAQQKARALEEIQRKQKEERQRKIIADEAKQAKHDAEIKSIRSILLSLVPSVSRLKVIFERTKTRVCPARHCCGTDRQITRRNEYSFYIEVRTLYARRMFRETYVSGEFTQFQFIKAAAEISYIRARSRRRLRHYFSI